MAVLFISKDDDPADHRAALSSELPDLEFRVWPDAGDPAEVEFALVWKPEPGLLPAG